MFVSEESHGSSFLEAAALDGQVAPWRISADGTQWYRVLPEIHGGPLAESVVMDDDDDFDERGPFDDED